MKPKNGKPTLLVRGSLLQVHLGAGCSDLRGHNGRFCVGATNVQYISSNTNGTNVQCRRVVQMVGGAKLQYISNVVQMCNISSPTAFKWGPGSDSLRE